MARTVYLRVKMTESTKNRFCTALVKLSGKFQPWLPLSSGQWDADILNTSSQRHEEQHDDEDRGRGGVGAIP